MSISTQDKYEQEMKKIDITIGKKNSELSSMIQDLQIRTKTLEDEINEENEGDLYNSNSKDHIKSKILQTKNSLAFESDVVNQNSAAEEEGEVVIEEIESKMKTFEKEPTTFEKNPSKTQPEMAAQTERINKESSGNLLKNLNSNGTL